MDFSYKKKEKLKSKKTIEALFSAGKSVAKYPLRLVFIEDVFADEQKLKLGVSVSKRNFKKAVDRNYFKRVLRETFRLNKHLLLDNLPASYSVMFFYQTKERLTYKEINIKTIQLFEKFVKELLESKDVEKTII